MEEFGIIENNFSKVSGFGFARSRHLQDLDLFGPGPWSWSLSAGPHIGPWPLGLPYRATLSALDQIVLAGLPKVYARNVVAVVGDQISGGGTAHPLATSLHNTVWYILRFLICCRFVNDTFSFSLPLHGR